MKQTDCRKCGDPVFWAKSRNDKNMLMDLNPVEGGKFAINGIETNNPLALRIGGGNSGDTPATAYNCHFDTCRERQDRD